MKIREGNTIRSMGLELGRVDLLTVFRKIHFNNLTAIYIKIRVGSIMRHIPLVQREPGREMICRNRLKLTS